VTRKSIGWALLLPSMYSAVVMGIVLVEGDDAVLGVVALPWILVYLFMFFALGLLLDPLLRLAGLPNPFVFGHNFGEAYWFYALPLINVGVLYVVGGWIDQAIEQRRRRSAGTQP
jgi:hypothetical protein